MSHVSVGRQTWTHTSPHRKRLGKEDIYRQAQRSKTDRVAVAKALKARALEDTSRSV
jgi:hypothetical protein